MISCTQEVHERDTFERGGLLYKKGETEPFTGIVIGRGREGYRRQAYDFQKEYKNGVRDGDTIFMYSNGKRESKVPYKGGVIHGQEMRYWANGKPKARIHYEDGMRGGLRGEMFWDERGRQIKS